MTQRKPAQKGSQPLISVIIPVYNAEKTIARCLDSLLSQTIADQIEIIAIDDGSTDGSWSILKQYQIDHKERVKVIRQTNAGPSAARNRGLARALGKFIGFVDSDDHIAPQMYEKMVNKMDNHDTDLVIAGRYNIDPSEKAKEVLNQSCPTNTSIRETPQLISQISLFVWDKLFRRTIIADHELKFHENFTYVEDAHFLLRYLYYAKRIATIPEPLYYYYTNGNNSATGTCNSRWLHIPMALSDINKFFIDHGMFAECKGSLFRLAEGYYCRRIDRFPYSNHKYIQWQFVKDFYRLFDYYFAGWKDKVDRYRTKHAKRYRSSLPGMFAYIYLPNPLQRIYFSIKSVVNKQIKQLTKLRQGRYRYARYRKQYPVDDSQVLFMSYFGGNITDSPYYMMKELSQHGKMRIYAASRQLADDRIYLDRNNLSNVKLVAVHSPEFIKLLATAKYIINNSRLPDYVIKRPGQVFLNTWHGTPLKTLGRDMHTGLKDLGNNQTQFLMSDYLLYPNEYTHHHIMDAFDLSNLYSGKVIMTGYPRNDILKYNPERDKLRRNLGLDDHIKAYAYMPTWRGETISTTDVSKYKSEIESILSTLDSLLNDNVIIFIKLHQVVMKKIALSKYRHIRPFDSYMETYNFLSLMDGLITDYSSVLYDYANTERDIILFAYDYKEYFSSRGTYVDIKSLPFPIVDNIADLANRLNKIGHFTPDKAYSNFIQEYCRYDKPNNSSLVNEIIFRDSTTSQVVDYSSNAETHHRVIFCTNLATADKQEEFRQLLTNLQPHDILVFKQKTFKPITNDVIRQYDQKIQNYIVIPASTPLTISDKIKISIYRKTGLLARQARHIYRLELQRILPGIAISTIENYTNDKRLRDMAKLFGDHCRATKVTEIGSRNGDRNGWDKEVYSH